jgi:hypothetical protein
MPSPLQRLAAASRRRTPDGDPPKDERSLLQVLIGALVGGLIAGGVSALLGSGAVASIVFGFLIGVLFLWMDLRAQEQARRPPGG